MSRIHGGQRPGQPLLRRRREQLASFLRSRREHLDLDAIDVARRAGVTRWRYANWETAKTSIPSEILPALAAALQIELRALTETLYVDAGAGAAQEAA